MVINPGARAPQEKFNPTEFYAKALKEYNNDTYGQRLGQFLYNRLATEFNGTFSLPPRVDPFYNDKNIPAVLNWLHTEWS